jgi:uncharacterized membrane protein
MILPHKYKQYNYGSIIFCKFCNYLVNVYRFDEEREVPWIILWYEVAGERVTYYRAWFIGGRAKEWGTMC